MMTGQSGVKDAVARSTASVVSPTPISGLARATLLQKLGGYVNTQLIYLFARLRVADYLVTGACSTATLVAALGVADDTLYRLLRGWISVGLVTEGDNGDFGATPLAQLLVSDRPDSLRDYALLAGEEWYPAWGGLSQLIEAHVTPFEQVFGCDYYTHFSRKPDAGARFNRFMEMRTVQTVQALLESYDFSQARVLVDIGGGNGTLLHAVLEAYPQLQGILFDQPAAVEAARQRAELAQFGSRCQSVGGDFFQDLPPVGDHYMLSQVLHNWDDDACGQLLRNCRQSLSLQGTLLLLEQIIPPKIQVNQPGVEADLMMMVLLNGRERTAAEYERLLQTAGFQLTDLVALKRLGYSLIEAKVQPALTLE